MRRPPPAQQETFLSPVTNDRIRDLYRRQAGRYDGAIRVVSRVLDFDRGRAWACANARGRVLECGIGTGLNIPFYPADVELTGIDLSAEMLAVARRRAQELHRSIDLRIGDAAHLPFDDASFDTVVGTLTLCTIPDPTAALAEAWRVCRPGGELRYYDHGLARPRSLRLLQRALQPLTLRLEADRLTLDPKRVFAAADIEVDEVIRSRAGVCWQVRATRR